MSHDSILTNRIDLNYIYLYVIIYYEDQNNIQHNNMYKYTVQNFISVIGAQSICAEITDFFLNNSRTL